MQLNNSLDNSESIYFDEQFLIHIDSYMTLLKKNATVTIIDNHQSYKYEGDFYGLLDDLDIEKKYHHITMKINNLSSTTDYNGINLQIFIPDFTVIENLKNVFQTH